MPDITEDTPHRGAEDRSHSRSSTPCRDRAPSVAAPSAGPHSSRLRRSASARSSFARHRFVHVVPPLCSTSISQSARQRQTCVCVQPHQHQSAEDARRFIVIITDPVEARIAKHDGFNIEEVSPGVWLVGAGYREAQRRAALANAMVWRKPGPLMGNVLGRQTVLKPFLKTSRSHTRARKRTHGPMAR